LLQFERSQGVQDLSLKRANGRAVDPFLPIHMIPHREFWQFEEAISFQPVEGGHGSRADHVDGNIGCGANEFRKDDLLIGLIMDKYRYARNASYPHFFRLLQFVDNL